MSKNLYLELSERSKKILKGVVESFLETGDPAGSETILKKIGINISTSSIRSILANLQKEGLLYAPHTSSGRLPTDKGMRFFVDGLLEFGRLTKNEQENIKSQCQSRGSSFEELLEELSEELPKWGNLEFANTELKIKKISCFTSISKVVQAITQTIKLASGELTPLIAMLKLLMGTITMKFTNHCHLKIIKNQT